MTRTCLITGATSGIGRAAALQLAEKGFDLILVGRNHARGEKVCRQISRRIPSVQATFHPCDISSREAVRRLAPTVASSQPTLDVLINNAGQRIDRYQESVDGVELTFATNHLGHFLLTHLLLPTLKNAPAARIINVSSSAHAAAERANEWVMRADDFNRRQAYARSKLANILFTAELTRLLRGSTVTANAVHPGMVASGFARNNGWVSWSKHMAAHALRRELVLPRRGADSLVYLATSGEVEGLSGAYFSRRRPTTPSPAACDTQLAGDLWAESCRRCGLSATG